MKAIILAGGLATRMPNKMMLATRFGRPVIGWSIEQALRMTGNIRDIKIVVQSLDDPIVTYVKIFEDFEDSNFEVLEPTGVMNALVSSRFHKDNESTLILFGDCVAHKTLPKMSLSRERDVASVYPGTNDELDGWSSVTARWEHRDLKPIMKFCGFIYATSNSMDCLDDFPDLISWMNACIRPMMMDFPIYDLGTPETYKAHWNG